VHAIHHSSEQLDWLSAVRVHPLNDIVSRTAQVLPFLLLGFAARVVVPVLPFLTVYAIAVHANVSWDFGPLRAVLASPRFHRWHHSSRPEGLDRNFAGLFPFWDIVFGTYYLPRDRSPQRFGVLDEDLPEGFTA